MRSTARIAEMPRPRAHDPKGRKPCVAQLVHGQRHEIGVLTNFGMFVGNHGVEVPPWHQGPQPQFQATAHLRYVASLRQLLLQKTLELIPLADEQGLLPQLVHVLFVRG